MKGRNSLTAGIAQEILEMRYGKIAVSEVLIDFSPNAISKMFSVIGFLPICIENMEEEGVRNYYGYCERFEPMKRDGAVPIYRLFFSVNKKGESTEIAEIKIIKEEAVVGR